MFDYEEYYKQYNLQSEAKYEELTEFLRSFSQEAPPAKEKGFRQRMAEFTLQQGQFLMKVVDMEARFTPEYRRSESIQTIRDDLSSLYTDILPQSYASSLVSFSGVSQLVGKELAPVLTLYAHIFRNGIQDALKHRRFLLAKKLELYFEMRRQLMHGQVRAENLRQALHEASLSVLPQLVELCVHEMYDPNDREIGTILAGQDLSDPDYLYEYGLPVTEEVLFYQRFFSSLDEESVRQLSRRAAQSVRSNLLIDKFADGPRTCCVIKVPMGCERLAKALKDSLSDTGLDTALVKIGSPLEGTRYWQDHLLVPARILGDEDMEAFTSACTKAAADCSAMLKGLAGRVTFELNDSMAKTPRKNSQRLRGRDQRIGLRCDYMRRVFEDSILSAGQLYKTSDMTVYIPSCSKEDLTGDAGRELSYAERFTQMIDLQLAPEEVPQRPLTAITDAMDYGEFLYLKGRSGNETDLTIGLPVSENQRAESNMLIFRGKGTLPDALVGTVPAMPGTNGILHVRSAVVQGQPVTDLKIVFQDGVINSASYVGQDGKTYEADLSNRVGLSISRLRMGLNFSIEETLLSGLTISVPTKIQEQTCLSVTYGIRPSENTLGIEYYEPLTRKHVKIYTPTAYAETTVSIPYEELSRMSVIHQNGSSVDILREGMFVLIGTDHLNSEKLKLDQKRILQQRKAEETQPQTSGAQSDDSEPAADSQPQEEPENVH